MGYVFTVCVPLDSPSVAYQWYPDVMEWQALKTLEEFVAAIPVSEQQWFTKASAIINRCVHQLSNLLAVV